MKKSTKILLLGGLLLVLVGGLIMLITGGVIGGQKLGEMIENGDLTVDIGDVGFVGYHFDDEENTAEGEAFVLEKEAIGTSAEFKNLEIDFGAGELQIKESEDEYMYLDVNHSMFFKYGIDEEQTLYIKPKKKNFANATGEMVLYLPKGMVFEEVDFDLGAGEMTVEQLETRDLEVSVGAGTAFFKNLKCDVADMEVGAGEITVSQGDVKKTSLELAMGTATLNFCGKEEDYDYDLSCGAGEIRIGSMYSGGVGFDKETNLGREKEVKVECAMGTVSVNFLE